ncbi:1-acyl-sn-glycerol-3-phosphate acyltransferase alpha [Chelonia mydas]|uniref:1-acyl-sn-glycerol-3-phosphate acyltransferase alpha n=1 Tax=Chelonia mydas TaxID=8469 RepID=M7BR18_CHEMY|nr:1-acyl-sn-glycerol-3-phosphate acyltransferase alpha [Chelonia mydas]
MATANPTMSLQSPVTLSRYRDNCQPHARQPNPIAMVTGNPAHNISVTGNQANTAMVTGLSAHCAPNPIAMVTGNPAHNISVTGNQANTVMVPVIPIVMSSYRDFYSKKERRFTTGRWLIQVLAPMPTRGLGPEAVPELTESVRQTMLEAFDRLSGELSPGQDPRTPQ